MRFTDSHTHLKDLYNQGNLEAALGRASAQGIHRLITIGTSPEDWTLYRDIAQQYPSQVAYTVGLHPSDVGPHWEADVAAMASFLRPVDSLSENSRAIPLSSVPIGIGEIGLDGFHLPADPHEAAEIEACQRAAFEAQLTLAKSVDLPIVIHSRNRFHECLAILDASGVNPERVVFHCFVEGPAEIALLMERGMRASFTGIVTYKNAAVVRESLILQGADRLMIETDAPYLTPVPHRGKPNEPAYLIHTAEACAGLLGIPLTTLSEKTEAAVQSFWNL